jgi:hypothetical protein
MTFRGSSRMPSPNYRLLAWAAALLFTTTTAFLGGTVNGVCDPTAGYSFTPNTIANFGKVNLLRGRRIVEFALRYYF